MTSVGFWQLAAERPSALAVVEPNGAEVAAGQLLCASNQLVHGLRQLGLVRGDAVALATKNRSTCLEVYMAAMQAGFYFVPLHARLAAQELEYMLRDSGAKALVFDEAAAGAVEHACEGLARDAVLAVDDTPGFRGYGSLKDGQPSTTPSDRVAGETLFYTSGTTGRRRAVRRPLMDVSPEKRAAGAALHLRAAAGIRARQGGTHLVCSPLFYGAALLWCTDHMHVGHPVVLMENWTAEGMLARVEQHRVTSTFMVPTHFHRLLALEDATRRRYDHSTLKHVVHSGAPCLVELKKKMMQWWGPILYETYAATEGPGTQVSPEEWLARPGTVGKAGDRVRVMRPDGSPCASGEVGEVFLRCGPRAFQYQNNPEKTEASRQGDFFTVGDVGYLDDGGYLFLVDRADNVVISGGVNVYPAETEAVLRMHPNVADAVAFGVPDDEWGERLHALVVPAGKEPSPVLAEELAAFCKGHLAAFKCPRSIGFEGTLPREDSGKLSRRLVRARYWDGTAHGGKRDA